MLYRRNEKGRYEAVTDRGTVIPFEDESKMIAFIEARERIFKLLGSVERVECDATIRPDPKVAGVPGEKKAKRVKIRIHKDVYTVKNGKLVKKEKTA